MTNRLILGNKSGNRGLWISKPTKDVLTASSNDDFLLNTDIVAAQIVMSGYFTTGSTFPNPNLTIPNFGYRPIIEYFCTGWPYVVIEWYSLTSLGFRLSTSVYSGGYPDPFMVGYQYPTDPYLSYRVWSLPNE